MARLKTALGGKGGADHSRARRPQEAALGHPRVGSEYLDRKLAAIVGSHGPLDSVSADVGYFSAKPMPLRPFLEFLAKAHNGPVCEVAVADRAPQSASAS